MNRIFTVVFFNLLSIIAFSQTKDSIKKITPAPLNADPFINTVEQTLNAFYADVANQSNYDSIIDALNYEKGEIPHFTDDEYCERLEKMNAMSPFQLDCTPAALSTIKFFADKRRSFARVVLGRSALYFEMFEEKLAEYDLPIELKYLAVIESGLRPQVKSHAGALGLWQFMYRTGLYYGLNENSYIDERMDPELATDAACRYLKKLYGIYGDWNLALASYNAGPGNVNKAIRRSGGKKTYWEVRPFLPVETQGYVPNFIAAAYLLTYHAEHNIVPMEAKWNYAQLDTICLNSGIHMSTITKLTGWELDEIQTLNPVYKTSYIPETTPKQCISGPLLEIGKLVSLEDELYKLEKTTFAPEPIKVIVNPTDSAGVVPLIAPDVKEKLVTTVKNIPPVYIVVDHVVKRGEGFGIIAAKYEVTVAEILKENKIPTTSVLYVGQKLKIRVISVPGSSVTTTSVETITPKEKPVEKVKVKPVAPAKKYYNVKSGDTATKISQKHNLTQQQLKKLNPGVNLDRISPGQQLRVK